jgi:putative membrane protein
MKPGDETKQTEQRGNVQVHLAWLRTRMALERTLDAWVRTATALIGFGFTIVQFFEHFRQMQGVAPEKGPHLSRYVGLLLIGIGTLALGIAIFQYQKVVNYLSGESFRDVAGIPGMRPLYPALTVGILLFLVGLLAFFAILAGT